MNIKKTLLSILPLAIIAVGCSKIADEFVKYTILKGRHYCTGWHIRKCSNSVRFQFRFSPECLYDPANIVTGWNKLYGFCHILATKGTAPNTAIILDQIEQDKAIGVHNNSARIVWMSDGTDILLGYYTYVNGVRTMGELTRTKPGEINTGEIALKNGKYHITINDKTWSIDQPHSGGLKYRLFPYFGGQSTAPSDMHIYIKEM